MPSGSTQLSIILDSGSGSYFSGQIVTGRVILQLETERKTNGGPEFVLQAGPHVHPFSFQLPQGLPSSFQGGYGFVQYSLQATLKKSWGFDKTTKVPFSVNGLLDLNTWPGSNSAGTFTKTKHLGCCCCKSGPITINAKLLRIGLVPGQGLDFQAEIINLSNKSVVGIQLRITRHVTYRAQGRTKSESDRITEFRGDGVSAGETEIFRPDPNVLKIPPIPPTNLAGCNIIQINYQLEVELDMPSGHFNLKGTIPLIIGTIPFRNNFQQIITRPPADSQPSGSNQLPTAPSLIDGYPDLPPPTYEASCPYGKPDGAVGGDLPTYGEATSNVKSGDELDNSKQLPPNAFDPKYVPKYATYGWKLE